MGGGRSPCSKPYFRAKVRVSVFWNGQFSGHLIFYKTIFLVEKNNFFGGEKKFFYPYKQALCFFEKNYFSFLKKKCFWESFFRRIVFQNFQNFSAHKKFVKFFFEIFSQNNFPPKHFFSKKRKIIFFKKKKQSTCL